MIVEQKFERLVKLRASELPAMKSRINYSAVITPAHVHAHRSISRESASDLFPMFPPIEKIDTASTTVAEEKLFPTRENQRAMIDRVRKFLLLVAARLAARKRARTALLSASRCYVHRWDISFRRTQIKRSLLLSRVNCTLPSQMRAALSPCVESGVDTVRVCRRDNSVMDGQGQRALNGWDYRFRDSSRDALSSCA